MCKLLFLVVSRRLEHEQVNTQLINAEAMIGTSPLTRNEEAPTLCLSLDTLHESIQIMKETMATEVAGNNNNLN